MFLHFYKTFFKNIHKKHQNYQKTLKNMFLSCYKNIKKQFYIYGHKDTLIQYTHKHSRQR